MKSFFYVVLSLFIIVTGSIYLKKSFLFLKNYERKAVQDNSQQKDTDLSLIFEDEQDYYEYRYNLLKKKKKNVDNDNQIKKNDDEDSFEEEQELLKKMAKVVFLGLFIFILIILIIFIGYYLFEYFLETKKEDLLVHKK